MHEEPVEILVQLAERGEIDPWNIDIVEVTDRFFAELERCRELDLRISGRTLFFAATLLRMKSAYLAAEIPDELPEEEAVPDEEDANFGSFDLAEPIEQLEREIQRRIGRKKVRRRPVTLYELITELKSAEKEERRRQRQRSESVDERMIRAADVVSVAHDEDYQAAASAVLGCCDAIASGGEVKLCDICSSLQKATMEVYIPLLFLMLEGKVDLRQEEYFGDLYVRRVDGGQNGDA
ncbi:chromosome segregation and condensation protein ScpA [Methanofollis liminatans DSM 4140]|jgi:segregation and condensation protein A|uniref:Chromosome segregation and condensation protein ScpA n=1 Tax=Methanofollis liminatans DSM 4140 TaxID=28892 RepID=J1L0P8_9EURY|nr:ScpA family protein [Methanofollis liminatans]EJG06572.1 chromosome segregation and condensation protein ScpA [Methanofollis liminatans DSM 4140]